VVWCSGWGRVETGASSRIEQGEGAAAYRHEALSEGVFKVGARAHGAIVARLHAEKGEGAVGCSGWGHGWPEHGGRWCSGGQAMEGGSRPRQARPHKAWSCGGLLLLMLVVVMLVATGPSFEDGATLCDNAMFKKLQHQTPALHPPCA
jgi:hypothetical protein